MVDGQTRASLDDRPAERQLDCSRKAFSGDPSQFGRIGPTVVGEDGSLASQRVRDAPVLMISPLHPPTSCMAILKPQVRRIGKRKIRKMPPRTTIKEMVYDYRDPIIERIGPILLKVGVLAAALAILLPAVIALVGPFIG
ncbi:MAG: hypothetical protein OXD42_04860 [Rhodospirillaceae bacterium]|nr:hypothetical protein [Rhodospirillaceae bacterium]